MREGICYVGVCIGCSPAEPIVQLFPRTAPLVPPSRNLHKQVITYLEGAVDRQLPRALSGTALTESTLLNARIARFDGYSVDESISIF